MDEDVKTEQAVPNEVAPESTASNQPEETKPEGTQVAAKPEAGASQLKVQTVANVPGNSNQGDLKVALREAREQIKELRRQVAGNQGQDALSKYSGDDLNSVLGHPLVQEIMVKQAEMELRQGTEKLFSNYPQIPESLKKAVLQNPRGFIRPDTQDVQTGLLDIEEYLDAISSQELPQQVRQDPADLRVASTNSTATSQTDAELVEIQKILAKPPELITPEEEKLLKQYEQSLKK